MRNFVPNDLIIIYPYFSTAYYSIFPSYFLISEWFYYDFRLNWLSIAKLFSIIDFAFTSSLKVYIFQVIFEFTILVQSCCFNSLIPYIVIIQ